MTLTDTVAIGQFNCLQVAEVAYEGCYLSDADGTEVFLAKSQYKTAPEQDSLVDVFVYQDQFKELSASFDKPLAICGEVALLKISQVNNMGAFASIGLEKDVLVPFNEQKPKCVEGQAYLLYLYQDKASGRLCATTKLAKFLDKTPHSYQGGEQVNIVIANKTPMGIKVVVENKHFGLLYADSVFKKLYLGQKLKAYIARVREDGKLDIRLDKVGVQGSNDLSDTILARLTEKGRIPLGDKSTPEAIQAEFACSKAQFKRAIGHLFKQGKIHLEATSIELA
jgi:hypothetical protein